MEFRASDKIYIVYFLKIFIDLFLFWIYFSFQYIWRIVSPHSTTPSPSPSQTLFQIYYFSISLYKSVIFPELSTESNIRVYIIAGTNCHIKVEPNGRGGKEIPYSPLLWQILPLLGLKQKQQSNIHTFRGSSIKP